MIRNSLAAGDFEVSRRACELVLDSYAPLAENWMPELAHAVEACRR